MQNKITLLEIKKYLKKKRFIIFKQVKNNNIEENSFNTLSRTFISCLIIISAFIIFPVVTDFFEKGALVSKNFENNSKNNFNKTLNDKNFKLDEDLNKTYLFEDILQFDQQSTDAVRLSASTIQELFKSTNYNLEDVRKNKLVKPISLTFLPEEIKEIENVKKRKDLFIKII